MGFVWLRTDSFAVAHAFNHDLSVFEKNREGVWVQRRYFKQVDTNDWRGLTALSDISVAWHSASNIWRLDFDSGSPQLVWTSGTNKLEGFSYRTDDQEFRVACTDEKGWLTVRLGKNEQHRFSRTEDRPRCAWARDEGGVNNLYVKTESQLDPLRIEWRGALEDHQGPLAERLGTGKYLFGDALWLVGNPLNNPPGIWRLGFESGELRCVVSGLKQPLRHAHIRGPSQEGWLTNSAGVPMNWHLWEPTSRRSNERHPLIVTQTPYVWLPYPEVAAQAGYYFAMVDRPYWNDPTIYNWADDVMTLYNLMAKIPQIDTDRVYLMGTSWDTSFVGSLFREHGALWRGLILINPGKLIDLSQFRQTVRVFVAAGQDQDKGEFAEELRQFQQSGLKLGIQVRLCLQAGADHNPNSIATWRGRTVEFARFLSED
jgi:pimeloyl-ACP methyl ester carboxylesterase